MRPQDIIRKKERFEMFNDRSREKVLELNKFFGKHIMHFEEKIKKTFIYYDTPDHDLEKSNIVLYKTQIGNMCELNMATEKVNEAGFRYTLRTHYKHFLIPIKPHDSLLKHKDFLIDSFTSMFLSSINFDPEFLMKRLQPTYNIETTSLEYRSMNVTGLKITYSFDKDKYTNLTTKIAVEDNVLTIYQHSSQSTDEAFDDLIGKLSRYCKELTQTNETKIMIARRLTSQRLEQMRAEEKARIEREQALAKQKRKK